ncbi:MAG: hypothetical protein Q9226_006430 [Calogaya cf. arnoldii]
MVSSNVDVNAQSTKTCPGENVPPKTEQTDPRKEPITFGKHKDTPIDQLPLAYIKWLVKNQIYKGKLSLTEGLLALNYLTKNSEGQITPADPAAASQKRKLSSQEAVAAAPSAKKTATSVKDKQATPGEAPSYRFTFGKHRDQTLDDVEPKYIDWLIMKGLHDKEDLRDALRRKGIISGRDGPPYTRIWIAPSIDNANPHDPNIFNSDGPRWISDTDAAKYFRVSEKMMHRARIPMLSKQMLDSWIDFGSIVVDVNPPKRWLFHVYCCAEHFGTVGDQKEALERLLGKNRRREREMMDQVSREVD